MSEYVIMPKADYVAACNAIRTKTEKTDLIKSSDMEPEILSIASGGGSSADVRYVTFMNEDGSEELGKKAVATGDDCADPIARGIFDTPTKASDVQYNYTFSGSWATTPNGGKDSNALKAVTEDRTVYANFIAAVRYYTITYYDSDGTTVLKTESLAYGAMPSYEPTKDNFVFSGWNPTPVAVAGNISYTAVWEEKITFATASWNKISEIAASGKATEYFAVGDEKTITLNNGSKMNCIIVGFNHDSLSNNIGKAPITVAMKNVYNKQVTIGNISKTTTNAYYNSNIRTELETTVFDALPEDLTSVIKLVSKECYLNSSSLTNNSCYLFPFAAKELGLSGSVGTKYSYFGTTGVEACAKRKLTLYGGSTYVAYWLRDHVNYNNYMNSVSTEGTGLVESLSTSTVHYLHFGFCI